MNDELTGGVDNGLEATSVSACSSFALIAGNSSHRILGLLQHYPHKAAHMS
jgi:hypothetical protein